MAKEVINVAQKGLRPEGMSSLTCPPLVVIKSRDYVITLIYC